MKTFEQFKAFLKDYGVYYDFMSEAPSNIGDLYTQFPELIIARAIPWNATLQGTEVWKQLNTKWLNYFNDNMITYKLNTETTEVAQVIMPDNPSI